MPSFSHIVGFALVALSLGYAVSALPTDAFADMHIVIPVGTDVVSCLLAKICFELEAKSKALLACGSMAELVVAVDILVALLKGCADDLLKIGAGVDVNIEAQASIVACIASFIALIVKVCLQVSLKFGITACAVLFAKIDIVLKLLLVNLNICIGGILALIVKALVNVSFALFAQLQFKLCLTALASAGLGISV